MATEDPHCLINIPVILDVPLQQNRQTLGPLLPLPGGCPFYSNLHRLWLLPRSHQALGAIHSQRGELTDWFAESYEKLTHHGDYMG